MRKITLIIIHCSATPEGRNLDFEACRHDHIHHRCRPIEKKGGHCKNHNRHSVGICYEGGLSSGGVPTDTRTLEQKAAMLALLRELRELFPTSLIVGHHDLNPMKPCPCFNVVKEMAGI